MRSEKTETGNKESKKERQRAACPQLEELLKSYDQLSVEVKAHLLRCPLCFEVFYQFNLPPKQITGELPIIPKSARIDVHEGPDPEEMQEAIEEIIQITDRALDRLALDTSSLKQSFNLKRYEGLFEITQALQAYQQQTFTIAFIFTQHLMRMQPNNPDMLLLHAFSKILIKCGKGVLPLLNKAKTFSRKNQSCMVVAQFLNAVVELSAGDVAKGVELLAQAVDTGRIHGPHALIPHAVDLLNSVDPIRITTPGLDPDSAPVYQISFQSQTPTQEDQLTLTIDCLSAYAFVGSIATALSEGQPDNQVIDRAPQVINFTADSINPQNLLSKFEPGVSSIMFHMSHLPGDFIHSKGFFLILSEAELRNAFPDYYPGTESDLIRRLFETRQFIDFDIVPDSVTQGKLDAAESGCVFTVELPGSFISRLQDHSNFIAVIFV